MAKKSRTKRVVFTTKRVRELPIPDSGRQYHYDSRTPGLCVCVTAAGGRTFYLYRWANGPQRVRLGRFPDVSVDQARKAAAELVGRIAEGRDVAAERRARRESPTLGDLFDHWFAVHSKPHKRTSGEDQRMFSRYVEKYRTRRLATITKVDIQRWHAAIGKSSGHYQANRVWAMLSAMFNVAEDLGHTGPNPCTGVKRFKEASRERFLQPREMRPFFQAVAEEDPLWRDYFLLLLLTGARKSNLCSMRWDQVDLERAVWYLPGKQTKGGVALAVVLPGPALDILRTRREADPDGVWVFPSDGAQGHIVDPRKPWERIRKRSGLTDLRMHDLRRSLGSWQAALGSSLQVIGKSLGHRDMKATQVYSRLQLDPVRESVERATRAMIEAGEK